jgi:hypothetical protein
LGLTEVTVGSVAVCTVTVAVAVTDVSATEVAVMMTVLGEGTVEGAVYTPEVEVELMVPIPVRVVESDQVTLLQVGLEVMLHPGLLTVAVNAKVSLVPTVAEVGVTVMLIPVMIVRVAVATLEVSACEVAVTVTVGAIVVVPLEVVVGIVAGAVKSPVASMVPQEFAATPVAHVRVQLTEVLLEPVTAALNC